MHYRLQVLKCLFTFFMHCYYAYTYSLVLPVSGFSLASFTSLEAGNRKSDITICHKRRKTVRTHTLSNRLHTNSYKMYVYLKESFSARLAANVVSLSGTPERKQFYKQRQVSIQEWSFNWTLVSGTRECVLLDKYM